ARWPVGCRARVWRCRWRFLVPSSACQCAASTRPWKRLICAMWRRRSNCCWRACALPGLRSPEDKRMPYELLRRAVPGLPAALENLSALQSDDALWPLLCRLLDAHAPSGGANLPGGVGEEIGALADALGLSARWIPELGATGNAAIALGADGPADVVAVAHMDRPSFRVASPKSGALFPICANRFPEGEYRVGAKALRFVEGRLAIGARGTIVSRREDGG